MEGPGGLVEAAAIVAVLAIGLVAFAAAVWLGLSVIAPRLGRALDRADADADEDPA